jgi:hypothetical protein
VNLHNKIPVDVLHVLKADVPEDTSVVNEHIDAAKVLDRRPNDGLAILDAVVVRDGCSAGLPDLVDDDISGLQRSAFRFKTTRKSRAARTLVEVPSPLNEPPRSLTTTLAPRAAKNSAYALPSPPPAPVTTTVWPSKRSSDGAIAQSMRFKRMQKAGRECWEISTGRSDVWADNA